jgi:hypothetical protein
MGMYPLVKRPAPVFEVLKNRPTVVLKEPLAKKLNGEHSTSGCTACETWAKLIRGRRKVSEEEYP